MRYVCFTLHNKQYANCLKAVVDMFYKICPKGLFTNTYLTNDFLKNSKQMFCDLLYDIIYLQYEMFMLHANSLELDYANSSISNLKTYIDNNFDMFLTDWFCVKPAGNSIYLDLETICFTGNPVIYLA